MRNGSLAGALLVGWLWALQVTAGAQPAAVHVDLNADQRSLVIQLTAERAVTLAREHRLADEAQQRFYEQLAAKDLALRAAQARAAGNAAELARVRKARDEIARQREELIAAVQQRDRTLAAELSAYREEVTKLVSSPDLQTQKALQRFADGEQREALDDLDLIADAKRAARDKAVVIADAAERRPTAWLAVQALDAGEVTLDKVVERFEKLTRLDPGVAVDWIELGRLYSQQGRLADVQKANESALRSLAAGDERTRAGVLNELGDVGVIVTTGQLGDQFHRITGVPGTTPHRLPPRAAGEVKGRRRRRAQRARPRRRRGPCDRGSRGWSPRRRWQAGPGSGGAGGFGTLVPRW